MLLMGFILDIISNSPIFNSPLRVLWIFLMMIFVGVLGSFYGILMYKSAKLGFAVYVATLIPIIIGIGVYVGFSTVSILGQETEIQADTIMVSLVTNPVLMVVFIAASVILAAVNWLLVKKLEVKT
jgi:hypothetical protein